jgi:hypothetical protein
MTFLDPGAFIVIYVAKLPTSRLLARNNFRLARDLYTIGGTRRYAALIPRADQVLLLLRGYSLFNSAVQFSITVMDSDEVVPVSTRTRLPSGATSQPKTRKACSLWPI